MHEASRINRSSFPTLFFVDGVMSQIISVSLDWVPPRNISDMMFINYKSFGTSKRGIVLWQNVCIALIWVVWQERNVRLFEDKARDSKKIGRAHV